MLRTKMNRQPVGSVQWTEQEREQHISFVKEVLEEFAWTTREHYEWLNAHMELVYSKGTMTFMDVFKTPSKLRGRTPRTALKRHQTGLGSRQPLTDRFAPSVPAPPQLSPKVAFYDKVAHFDIAEDAENQPLAARPTSRGKSPQRIGKPGYTDSGYHGMMTEDEMEMDAKTQTATMSNQQSMSQRVPLREGQQPPQRLPPVIAEVGDSSNESFTSAKEDLTGRNVTKKPSREKQAPAQDETNMDREVTKTRAVAPAAMETGTEPMDQDHDMDGDLSRSDASSPDKPLQRKSSFTFTSLPAREPLTAKRSVGVRNSQVDTQAARESTLGRSFGGRSLVVEMDEETDYMQEISAESKAHNKTSTQLLHERIIMLSKANEPRTAKSIPQSTLAGQSAHPPTSATGAAKTVQPVDDSDDDWIAPVKPSQRTVQEPVQRQAGGTHDSQNRPAMHQKSVSATQIPSPSRPSMDSNAVRHLKAISVSNPSVTQAIAEPRSTTPAGSPASKKGHDGPLSASKNKLYSVLKSAKSIFASSASASAAAKLEAHTNSPARSPTRDISNESKTTAVFNMPGALYSDKQLPKSPSKAMSVLSASPSKKCRNSNESDKKREKELKAQQKAAEDLEKAREKERQKAAKQREGKQRFQPEEAPKFHTEQGVAPQDERPISARNDRPIMKGPPKTVRPNGEAGLSYEEVLMKQMEEHDDAILRREQERSAKELMEIENATKELNRPTTATSDKSKEEDMPPPPPPKNDAATGKSRVPGRLVKPTREPQQPAKPAPVSIRVASQSLRAGQNLSKSQHESSAPPPPAKQTQARPPSAQGSVRSSTAPSNARVRALEAAARKKEADEKAALEKAEKKRELERKRAAKAEEERKAEEEKRAAEQQRVLEAKMAAQKQAEKQAADAKRQAEKQAADAKRRDQQRLEQMRQQEDAQKIKAAHELADAIRKERAMQAQAQQHPRGDVGGTIRQVAKESMREKLAAAAKQAVETNPPKPRKRVLGEDGDDDEPQRPPQHGQAPRPGQLKSTQRYEQTEAKRRRTNEEDDVQTNAAKPYKRPWQQDGDEESLRPQPQRPGLQKGPPNYQQTEAKRRRTNDDEEESTERHSVMAPPKRPSNMIRKESTLAKYMPSGYTQAPPAGTNHHTSMFKAVVNANQHLLNPSKHGVPAHPSQTVQVSNARIPFAENANPPATAPQHQGQMHAGHENVQPGLTAQQQQQKFKTPARPLQMVQAATKSAAKSSPSFMTGDNITLPEIHTDSEDEDSDDDRPKFVPPPWAESPALREMLTAQQLVDPETIFGPIGELDMDRVFRGVKNTDRFKRLRERGSSALWVESGDAVTSAEKRRDKELRERVVRNGGWTYEPNI